MNFSVNPLYYLAVIPIFGLLVFVHELGHFVTAKLSGIRVEEFGFGFPPRIFGIKRGETVYSLNWIPLGGFVRMPGENGETTDENGNYDPQSFGAKPAWKRIIVLTAGVTMNFLLAMVLFIILLTIGDQSPQATITDVLPGSPAVSAGLQKGDVIVSIDNHPVRTFSDVINYINLDKKNANGAATVPVSISYHQLGTTQVKTIVVNARVNPPPDQGSVGITGNASSIAPEPITKAVPDGFNLTFKTVGTMYSSIHDMIAGKVKPQLVGPVGIARITGDAASQVQTDGEDGWFQLIWLTGVLSLNLAIVNILPFPALDGGRLALVIVEVARKGRKLAPEREGLIHLAGMAVLLTLVAIISWNDIVNWISHQPLL